MKINVIGLGYIGLPTAAVFAQHGVEVVGVDVSQKIVDIVNDGKIHIEEPGLAELIKTEVLSGNLRASISAEKADAFIIAVPTPSKADEYKSCDLTYVVSAVKGILSVLEKGNTIIIESTMEPRATEDVVLPILNEAGYNVGKDVFLAHCPERVLPGQILYEVVHNDRIIGGITPECTEKAAKVYEVFVKGDLIKTEAKTAEMSKLMENTFRDVNIALANELTKICNSLDINALDVIRMANKHPRVNIHSPGPGVGGHCLAVDPYFIHSNAPDEAKIIKLSRDTNVSMPDYVVSIVEKMVPKNKIISALGVAYKPNVDDIRESPALIIIDKLVEKGYEVKVHDPHVVNEEYYTFEESIIKSELILFLTGHNEFKEINSTVLESKMNNILVFDTTNSIPKIEGVEFYNYGNIFEFDTK